MKNRLTAVLCRNVMPDCKAKLEALAMMSGQSEEDIAGMVLEIGIIEGWEKYRNNPKHAKEIKDWEEKNEYPSKA